jgi:hypothetical protein
MNKKEKTSYLNLTTRRRSYRKRTIYFKGSFYRWNGLLREPDSIVASDTLIVGLTCPNHPNRAYGNLELEVADVVPCKDPEDLAYITCFLRHNHSPLDLRQVVFITLFFQLPNSGWIHSICHLERGKRRLR